MRNKSLTEALLQAAFVLLLLSFSVLAINQLVAWKNASKVNDVFRSTPELLVTTTTPPTSLIPPLVETYCAEDDPCWNPATMGDGIGLICYLWPDGEIHAYHDTTGAIGERTDCPADMPLVSG